MTRISANRRENRVQRPVYMYGLFLPRFFLFLVDDKEIIKLGTVSFLTREAHAQHELS